MARAKQRETYGNGSVTPVMVNKTDADGNVMYGRDGKPVRVQKRDRRTNKPVWKVCISQGTERYVKDGKLRKRQRKIQKTVYGTLKEARAYSKMLSDEYERLEFDKATGTFSNLCDDWKINAHHNCSEKQKEQYIRFLDFIAPLLDDKPVNAIKRPDVESAIKQLVDCRNYSVTTRNKILAIVRRVFEYGIDEDYIQKNPCRGIPNEAGAKMQKRKSLNEKEAAKLRLKLDIEESRLYDEYDEKERRQADLGNTFGRSAILGLSTLSSVLAVRLMLATGIRRGEALGLTWDNVSIDKGTIRICQSLNETCTIKQPKTDNGIRSLHVDEHTMQHIRKWKSFQKRALHLISVDGSTITQDGETYVFVSDRGGIIDPTNFARWWNTFRVGIGFDSLLIHELRHTQVTLLAANGYDTDDPRFKTRIGHARMSSVTNTYLHELPARDEDMAALMGRILYETKVKDGSEKDVLVLTQKSA